MSMLSSLKKVLFGMALVTAGSFATSPAWALSNQFTVFDVPWAPVQGSGGSGTKAFGINNNGEVTGSYYDVTGYRGFIRKADGVTYTPIDVPGASETWAETISNTGWVSGGFVDSTSGQWRGFKYNSISGGYETYDATDPLGRTVNLTFLDYISDNGDFTGHYGVSEVSNEWMGFYVKGGVQTTFGIPNGSGGNFETQLDYKNGSTMAGHYFDNTTLQTFGFVSYDEGATFEKVQVGGYDETELERMNAFGAMVGYLHPYGGGGEPDAWYRDILGDDYLIFDPKPIWLGDSYAEGINDSGVIAGYFGKSLPDGSHRMQGYLYDPNAPSSVPEPSTILLTGAGIAALGFLKRRNNRNSR